MKYRSTKLQENCFSLPKQNTFLSLLYTLRYTFHTRDIDYVTYSLRPSLQSQEVR